MKDYCGCKAGGKDHACRVRFRRQVRMTGFLVQGYTDWMWREKVLGYGKYPDDYYLDGMCYGTALK